MKIKTTFESVIVNLLEEGLNKASIARFLWNLTHATEETYVRGYYAIKSDEDEYVIFIPDEEPVFGLDEFENNFCHSCNEYKADGVSKSDYPFEDGKHKQVCSWCNSDNDYEEYFKTIFGWGFPVKDIFGDYTIEDRFNSFVSQLPDDWTWEPMYAENGQTVIGQDFGNGLQFMTCGDIILNKHFLVRW